MEFGVLTLVICVGIGALFQIGQDPRITRAFLRRSLVVVALYLVYCACGMAASYLLFVLGQGKPTAILALPFWLLWLALGVIWLIRSAPGLRQPPAWLMRPWSMLDWTLLGLAAACAAGIFLS